MWNTLQQYLVINNNREWGTKEGVLCSFLFVRKEFMLEVVLVLNIGGVGLFIRLNRKKKKGRRNSPGSEPGKEHQVCGTGAEGSWCRSEESRRCILVQILDPVLSRVVHCYFWKCRLFPGSIAESSKVK